MANNQECPKCPALEVLESQLCILHDARNTYEQMLDNLKKLDIGIAATLISYIDQQLATIDFLHNKIDDQITTLAGQACEVSYDTESNGLCNASEDLYLCCKAIVGKNWPLVPIFTP